MRYCAVLLFTAGFLSGQTEKDWLNSGVAAFKSERYAEAIGAFQHAVDLNPGSVAAHLYLGTAYMQQFIPGSEVPENLANADRAQAEFQRVLDLDSVNKTALASMSSLHLNRKQFDNARAGYKRLLAVDPNNKEAYYSIGFSIWAEWYPAYSKTRTQLGMRPEEPGPIADAAARATLRAQWWTALDEGIWNLTRALELDPNYSDAMAYLNLFIRERADLRDTRPEYQQDVTAADRWVEKALAAKRTQAGTMRSGVFEASLPPPPPPPPPGSRAGLPSEIPQRIVIGSNIQATRLVARPDPVYPPLALQARIEGVVKMTIVAGKDGSVINIRLNSGHPLLVPAAIDAVKRWQYQPTLLNGQPVEVTTDIEVNFALPPQ